MKQKLLMFACICFCTGIQAAMVECADHETLARAEIQIIAGWGTLVCQVPTGDEWCCYDPC